MAIEIMKDGAAVAAPDTPALVTVAKAADVLGVTEATVYRMVRNGEIPAVKVRRVWRVNLTEFVARGGSL
ncbi:hypothetical protein ATOP_07350 [Granulimonas faecalis]|uniref:Helix-turn-helix domain-containing protein n=1 Tax=Granulimonas faecalis TaxID=2894155 RepID=A0AAV5B3Q1_9ACTN|nr:helix-turn-helix domain-containing protein [Granulimonas faecalis]GJM55080.1 hypothetical protein ATOP_07350 [Granulimonas faecalis]